MGEGELGIKVIIDFAGRVAKDGYAFENKELYNTNIKISKEQNIILDKNFDNHVYKTAIIRQPKHKVIK